MGSLTVTVVTTFAPMRLIDATPPVAKLAAGEMEHVVELPAGVHDFVLQPSPFAWAAVPDPELWLLLPGTLIGLPLAHFQRRAGYHLDSALRVLMRKCRKVLQNNSWQNR